MGARCACYHILEHTFQKVLEELVHTAEEEAVGMEKNSFDLEGKMCCNAQHMAWKQVGGRTLEHYWTSQSEEHREPHQLVLLAEVDSILENWKEKCNLSKIQHLKWFKSKALFNIEK